MEALLTWKSVMLWHSLGDNCTTSAISGGGKHISEQQKNHWSKKSSWRNTIGLNMSSLSGLSPSLHIYHEHFQVIKTFYCIYLISWGLSQKCARSDTHFHHIKYAQGKLAAALGRGPLVICWWKGIWLSDHVQNVKSPSSLRTLESILCTIKYMFYSDFHAMPHCTEW